MTTYSFLDVQCSIIGPGGAFILGNGAGAAEEGITAVMNEDKNSLVVGADGAAMHSLHAGQGGVITIRLLKTSPYNANLMLLHNTQRQSAALWGQNTIVVNDSARGDVVTGLLCAFKKAPDLTYAKDGGMNEWAFDVGNLTMLLGTGVPDANT